VYNRQVLRYFVLVKFSSDEKIDINCDEIYITIKSPPKRGEANRELIKKLAGHFHVSEDRIEIISGFKSRKKIIQVL
jgi:uncharacterized protein